MRRPRIDLNADAGEGFDSAKLFSWISSASIACGGHAGDAASMRSALALCRASGVAAGAHPGYEDRARFGRVEYGAGAREIAALVARQIGALAAAAVEQGLSLAHWKPHGALYHRLSGDATAAAAAVAAVAALDPELPVIGFPGSALLAAASARRMPAIPEEFADRGYGADGILLPRGTAGALLGAESAAAQAVALARPGGAGVATLCVHSDSPGAATIARAVRQRLETAGFDVVAATAPARLPPIAELHVVGAAVVEGARVLLTRRGPAMSMPGKWEFPGGKVDAGEEPEAALAREAAEELALELEVGAHLGRGTALVDGRRIVLDVYRARRRGGELRLAEHDACGWFAAAELAALDWPEADLPILPLLAGALGGPERE